MKDFITYLNAFGEIGFVAKVQHQIIYVTGLPSVQINELVSFESGGFGQVLSLDIDMAEILVFSKHAPRVGTRIARTNQYIEVTVDTMLLGQVVDVFGSSLTGSAIQSELLTRRSIYASPGGIGKRKRINRPFETGVGFVDLSIPLGKGQRELVIGDRKTGKTTFLLQTILNQARQGSICVYAAIGKKRQDIKRIEEFFIENGIQQNTVIVASSSDDPASMVYLTPYSAMTIAEFFRDQKKDVLVVFDDLVSHAKFYREIALLGGRFPGRNSYPGDIFYTHAHLLERAGNFRIDEGEVSITCLVVAETMQGDLSGYIQTNLMSMTDGHIFFDIDLFTQGRKPAINPFLSVTRVGKQVQQPLHRDINRELNSFLIYYEKMKNFVHFSADLNKNSHEILDMGDRIVNFFIQPTKLIIPTKLQVFLFSLLWYGNWKEKSVVAMKEEMQRIIKLYVSEQSVQDRVDKIIDGAQTLNGLLKNFDMMKTTVEEILSRVYEPAQNPPTA
jgi:F-type H+-transporting ATPase subunit alpha